MATRKITLITMSQGNMKALKKTLDSFKDVVDEFVYGDMLLFDEDRVVIQSYIEDYNFRSIRLPFNYIFQMGFSSVLNYLATNAKNDIVIYMNTSEAIETDNGIKEIINGNPDLNTFFFDHKTDKHRWFRCYDRRELSWSGNIHEELTGDFKPYHKPIFRMMDYEKDMDSSFKAKVFNDVKELCYFHNYLKLVDNPKGKGATNDYWVKFVADQYDDMKGRLEKKGKRYEAFKTGNFDMFMNDIYLSKEFEEERFESSDIINYQGARKIVL